MLKIGSVKLQSWAVMAPMAGITNLPFRGIVKKMGAGLVSTEMVSAMGLLRGQKKTLRYLKHNNDEAPLAVQIFGSIPDVMAEAGEIAVAAGGNIVDINMGCPARKVLKTGAGGALLLDPKTASAIIRAVRKRCSVPLTVKIRTGWSQDKEVACEIARAAEDCGADAITIHARFVKQGFAGQADWSIITNIKKHVNIPVIGNGDVFKTSDAFDMKTQTGCDGIMIGRAAVGNPWIFKHINQVESGIPTTGPSLKERKAVIMEHFDLLSVYMGEHSAARMMRGLLLQYTKGLAYSGRFRGHITRIKDTRGLVTVLNEYFALLEGKNSCG